MYGCRQIRSGQQDGDDVYVHLSVVTMSQCTDGDAVTLNCSLSTYGHCRHTVKWLYDGKNVDEDNRLTTSQADCSVAVTWLELRSNDTRWDSGFQCEVTDDSTGAVRRFPFTPQPSGEETAKSSTPAEDTTSTGWLRLVIVSAGLITLVVVVVTVDIWSRTKGNKTLMDKNTVDIDEDEDEGSVEYENDGDPSASVRFH
ncbi:hypothetical protein Q5P01_004642 [Channa striata]|uniref:Ig-like domain-containing protein n=1 Tax=Channa striata TaxID=64152 RepID=A0AA88NF79_CHASR|nr:hypothetical protein Q5P01_004642 [Channa striata]